MASWSRPLLWKQRATCQHWLTKSIFHNTTRSFASPSLFVGGLAWNVDEKTLEDAFSTYGQVTEVRIMYDRDSGRSRGFGFVHFSEEASAKLAKEGMDGQEFKGRPIRIDHAIGKSPNPRSSAAPRLSPIASAEGNRPPPEEPKLFRDWNSG